MKKKSFLIPLVLFSLLPAGCNTTVSHELQDTYLDYQKNGGTLSFEKWNETIKGKNGDFVQNNTDKVDVEDIVVLDKTNNFIIYKIVFSDGTSSTVTLNNSEQIDDKKTDISQIYNIYKKNGGTLSFEQWLESIKKPDEKIEDEDHSEEDQEDEPKYSKYSLPQEVGIGYYSDFDFTAKAVKMQTQIHNHLFKKHTVWVNYGSIGNYYNYTTKRISIDAPEANSQKIEYFYTGKVTDGKSYSGNREHVWPCANSAGLWSHDIGDPNAVTSNYIGGGSDLYHVRPANDRINTARGNSKFVEASDFPNLSWEEYKENEGAYSVLIAGATNGEYGSRIEVADDMKGDVARILAYVFVHYTQIGTTPQVYCGGLSFSQVMGYDEATCKKKLCEWNELDPPSETEKLRNSTVVNIQGNRNPFVDYPGLLPRMFGFY